MPAPRKRPNSPMDGWHFKDHFFARDGTVTTGNISLQNWEWTNIANGGTYSFPTATPTTNNGVLRCTNAGADGDGKALHMLPDQMVLAGSSQGGGMAFRLRLTTTLATNDFRVGMDDSVTATAPDNGIGLAGDAGVLTLITYSAGHGDATQALAQPANRTLTSGTTMVVDTWHTFEINWTGTNAQGGPRYVECFVDGDTVPSASVLCNLDDDEDLEFKVANFTVGAATANVFDIDFFEAWRWS